MSLASFLGTCTRVSELRFCSNFRLLASLTYNLPVLRQMVDPGTVDGRLFKSFAGKKRADKEKLDRVVKMVSSRACAPRCARAAAVLAPTVSFTWLCADFDTPYSLGFPLALQLRAGVLAALDKNDFVDKMHAETAETNARRRDNVATKLHERFLREGGDG